MWTMGAEVAAIRVGDWKAMYLEKTGPMGDSRIWKEPFVALRTPNLFTNLAR